MIIDSHIHISYLKKKKELSDVKKELLLNMKKNKIGYSIVIPDNAPNPQCADLENVTSLTKNESKLFMLGTLKVSQITNRNLIKIDNLFNKKIIRGFKIFPGHDPVYPTDKRWHPVYNLCVKYDFPMVIHTGINTGDKECAKYNDPKHIIKIAKDYPKLKIIIAHYFWPKLDYCYSMTEGFNNIYFDTSAMADKEVVEESGGIKKIRKILTKTIKRNPDSVLFGTDWPMCDVKKHVDLINSLELTKKEKDKIFYQNAVDLFKLK
jgi:uncharacterized protein